MAVGSGNLSENKQTRRKKSKKPKRSQEESKETEHSSHVTNIHLEKEAQEKTPVEPRLDLLTLKKRVIEEVKNDLSQNETQEKYTDPFKRINNLENDMGVIQTVGMRKPETEECKMKTLSHDKPSQSIENKPPVQAQDPSSQDQEKVLDALTDLILEEYLNSTQKPKDCLQMVAEEQKQREGMSSFMAGLNKNRRFGQSLDPTIKEIGEEVIHERLEGIFKALENENKNNERFFEDAEKKGPRRDNRDMRESLGCGQSETLNNEKAFDEAKFRKNQHDFGNFGAVEEERNENSAKIEHNMRNNVSPNTALLGVGNSPNPIRPLHAASNSGVQQIIYQSMPMQQNFNLGDIQQIVQNTIANEMKKNVNYLEKRNNYPGSVFIQQPEVFQTHKVPLNEMTEEEVKLKAEENELKKGIAINIAPYAQQTLGINVNRTINSGYNNPFLGAGSHSQFNNPKILNLDEYELSSESEFYTEDELEKTEEENFSGLQFANQSNARSRYDIVRESEEYKQNDPKPSISQISSIEILKDKKQGKIGSSGQRRPKIMESDLDPEIEAAKRRYRAKGKIDITEDDEGDI